MKRDLVIIILVFLWGLLCGAGLNRYFLSSQLADQKDKIKILNAQVEEQRKTINAYQRALIGEERDLLSMYDSVQEAGMIDIIIHADTDSGLPVKYQMKCDMVVNK